MKSASRERARSPRRNGKVQPGVAGAGQPASLPAGHPGHPGGGPDRDRAGQPVHQHPAQPAGARPGGSRARQPGAEVVRLQRGHRAGRDRPASPAATISGCWKSIIGFNFFDIAVANTGSVGSLPQSVEWVAGGAGPGGRLPDLSSRPGRCAVSLAARLTETGPGDHGFVPGKDRTFGRIVTGKQVNRKIKRQVDTETSRRIDWFPDCLIA